MRKYELVIGSNIPILHHRQHYITMAEETYSSLILVPGQELRSTNPVVIDELESLGGTIIAPRVIIKKLTGTKLFIHNNSSSDSSPSSSDSSSDEEHGPSSSDFGNIGDNCLIGNFKVKGNIYGKRVGNIGNNCRVGNYLVINRPSNRSNVNGINRSNVNVSQTVSGIHCNNSSIHIGGNTVSGNGSVKQTIGKVSGNNSHVSFGPNTIGGGGYSKHIETNRIPPKTIVIIHEATNEMIDVQGDLVVSGRVQTKDLDIGGKLTITRNSELTVDQCISVNECLVEENGVIQTSLFGCNVATFQENSIIKASTKLTINTATVKQGASLVAHALELNSAEIKGARIICDTKCKGTSVELWDSFMSAHKFDIGNLKLKTSAVQFSDKLKVNVLDMENSAVKVMTNRSKVEANSITIKKESILDAYMINVTYLFMTGGIVNVDVLKGTSVVVSGEAVLNCAEKSNVVSCQGAINGPPIHKRQKVSAPSLDHLKDEHGNVKFTTLHVDGDLVM